MNTVDRNIYGSVETAGLVNGPEYHAQVDRSVRVDWNTPGLRVTRLRLVSDPGFPFWDVSYCHGELGGKIVQVGLPFSQLPKRGIRQEIVKWAQREVVYAKGLGILDNISTLC